MKALRKRPGDQQLPTEGKVAVGPAVINDIAGYEGFRGDRLREAVSSDFAARIALGIERYGHPLQTFNGRDAARDAYDELLDASHYLKQLHIETGRGLLAYWSVLGLVFDIKEMMLNRDSSSSSSE